MSASLRMFVHEYILRYKNVLYIPLWLKLILGMLEKFKVSKFLTFPKSFTILHSACTRCYLEFYLVFVAVLSQELIVDISIGCCHLKWIVAHISFDVSLLRSQLLSNSSIDWKSRPTKFWWLIRLRMSKCHLKGTDVEDIRLRVESNPDLISHCDWSRKLMPIHQSCTFKTKTNCNWLALSPAKSCPLVFSLG